MKKILLLILIILLAVPLISSANWDNKLSYSENDLKVTIRNSILGLIPTSEIGTAELKSHSSLNEIKEVGEGNQVPMWYDFKDFKEKYKGGLGEIIFTNETTGKRIDRDYSFVYWGTGERDNYDVICNGDLNATCERVLVGKETYEGWLPYDSRDIPKGDIRIGLQTYAEIGDKIDGVWTIAGKKVKKHAVWTVELNFGLVAYYKFDEPSGSTAYDSVGLHNGTIFGTPTLNVAGKIGTAYNFTATNQLVNLTTNYGNTLNHSINCWAYLYKVGNLGQWVIEANSGTDAFGFNLDVGTGTPYLRLGGYIPFVPQYPVDPNAWHMWTVVLNYDETNGTLYKDGVYNGSLTYTGGSFNDSVGWGSEEGSMDAEINGILDECDYYNRTLSQAEITQKYNGGAGITYTTTFPIAPEITLNAPANLSVVTNPSVIFNATGKDETDLVNMSLIINGSYITTNSSVFNNTLTQFPYTLTSAGFWNWTVEACDDEDTCVNATLRGITYQNNLAITLNTPVNSFNSSSQTILFNGTGIDDTTLQNISIIVNGSYNGTNSSVFNNTFTFFSRDLADGFYNWTMEACDNLGTCLNATARNISIDGTEPVITSNSSITFNYQEINTNLTIYFGIADPNSDICLYDYGGINFSIGCTNVSQEFNITDGINKTMLIFGNDTFGNAELLNITWDYTIFENSQEFVNQTLEGIINTFTANITIEESNSITIANFIYNGTSNTGSFSQSGNYSILTIDFLAPNVDADINLTFYWSLVLSDSQIINLTSHNQTVTTINIDDCSVNTVVLYNYTIVDEANQSLLSDPANTTAELNINILDGTRQSYIFNFSLEYEKINPFAVCINLNLSSSTYMVDSVVKYEALGYSVEYYNIINATITNITIPEEITLYDLFSADATEFKITFKAEDFTFVEDALIYIDRQYISENNTFKTVELPKTDSNGQTVGHFVRNDIVYNIRVIKEGRVLGNFKNIIAFCQDFTIGDCQMILEATPEDFTIFDYNEQLGIIFQTLPTYNENTSAITFDFSTDDGTIKTVLMEVTRNDIFGNRSICNNTIVSSGGTLSCSFDPNIADSVLKVDIFVNGQQVVLSNVKLEDPGYGNLGYVLWFFLTLFFILLFGHSKTGVLIGIAVSFIGAISLGIARGDIIGLGSAGIWVLLIVILGIVKLNKGKPQ